MENTINKKKVMFGFVFCFLFIIMIGLVSAVKPLTSVTSDEGYLVKVTQDSAIQTGQNHSFELHVFNVSNGMPITSGIACYMHLYHNTGKHLYEGMDATPDHMFDYSFDLLSGNFTSRGEYEAKFQCNSTTLGGESQLYFIVNDYGEELTTAHSFKFNASMFFMMILFIMAIIGIFGVENIIGKFACYWVAHLLFIVGTFSMWQFNMGYTSQFIGMASMWKILFYVSVTALFPLMILSIAGIILYYAMEKNVQRLIDKGMPEAEAYRRQGRKYK